jgi:hypothetical protein
MNGGGRGLGPPGLAFFEAHSLNHTQCVLCIIKPIHGLNKPIVRLLDGHFVRNYSERTTYSVSPSR